MRRPSGRSIAVMPLGNGSMCKASAAGWGFVLSVVCSLDSTIGASSAFDFRPYPNSARQRNKALAGVLGDACGAAKLERDEAHALCRGDETREVQPPPLARSDRKWRA